MTVNRSIDLFPEIIIEKEGQWLKNYLETTDFSREKTIRRCYHYIENNKTIENEQDRAIIHQAVRATIEKILETGVPPYLFERNLLTCRFVAEPIGEVVANSSRGIFISAYYYAINQLHYVQLKKPTNISQYLQHLLYLLGIKVYLPNTFESLCYGLPQLASSYTDCKNLQISGIGLEPYELGRAENILGGSVYNYLREYLTSNGQSLSERELREVLTRLNKGITELLAVKIASRTRELASNKKLVIELHQELGIPLSDVYSCYYTANRDKYIDLLKRAVTEKKQAKILQKNR